MVWVLFIVHRFIWKVFALVVFGIVLKSFGLSVRLVGFLPPDSFNPQWLMAVVKVPLYVLLLLDPHPLLPSETLSLHQTIFGSIK